MIDSKANLQVKPQDQMVYYLNQHSTLLSQISQQLSSIAPQVSIPPTPPPPFPKFNPLASAIRINFFWFMALIFSLSAALLAILLQKWVRDCMHVFQQYSDPLEIARLRQYLHEGFEAWRLPRFAEAIPGLLHISLFLFFAGLIDSLLNINTTVGLSAVIPIGIGVLFYIFTIFAPIIYPQSPYQNLFSRVVWHVFQKLHGRQYRDRGSNGRWRPVSANIAEGRMQLAMEETENRKNRDVLAIRWLIGNLTEGAKMEQLLTTLPGSFNSRWGVEIWKKVSDTIDDMNEDQSQFEPVVEPVVNTTVPTSSMPPVIQPSYSQLVREPSSHSPPTSTNVTALQLPNVIPHPAISQIGRNVVHELSARVARSLDACKNRERFAEDVWRERTCGCIETTASLVCGANASLAWFGDIRKLLGDIGVSVKLRELSLAGTDQVFVVRWTCLSLVAVQQTLQDDWKVRDYAELAVESYAGLAVEPLAREDDASYAQALAGAQKLDKTLKYARDCLYKLNRALRNTESLTEVEAILCDHVSEISDLENIDISIEAKHLRNIDRWISATQSSIAHQITSQIPGVPNDPDPALVPFSQLAEHFRDPRKLQFICPEQTLRGLCSIVPTLRSLLKGRGDADAYKEVRKGLREFHLGIFCWQENELRRQLWRLQDLRDASGFAFMVELFFLSLKQLLSTSTSPKNSHRDFGLYTGTFRAITSDWSKHRDSRGTQKLLLDVALSRAYDFQDEYPDYIVDEFVELTRKFFKGQEGVRIDEAIQQLNSFKPYAPKSFWDRLSNVITSARAP